MLEMSADTNQAREDSSAEPFLPSRPTLDRLHKAAQACRGCLLYRDATQAVMGEGPESARLMILGEQPGDHEDRSGKPFVGPAGRLLDESLEEAGIDRSGVFVTNTVKHFKWEAKGKRRIHQKPNAEEIRACRPWLDAEIAVVKPALVMCLGATAAQAMFGRSFRVTRERGQVLEHEQVPLAMATVHPSSIIRIRDREERDQARAEFVADLKTAARAIAGA